MLEQPDLISVIMPVYNHHKYVEESIESILKQTYNNIELIVVDDGSTDGSSDIIKRAVSKDHRMVYIYQNNAGTGVALNVGFSVAKGKYGTWVSSDNVYYSNMLQTLHNILYMHNANFVFSAFDIYSQDSYKCTHRIDGVNQTTILNNFLKISAHTCITGICYLFSMTLKNKCGTYIDIPGEDYYMGVCMGLETDVYYVPTVLGKYRSHTNSVSGRLENNSISHIKNGGISAVEMVKRLLITHNSIK